MTFRFSLTELSMVTTLFAATPNVANMQTAVSRNDPSL